MKPLIGIIVACLCAGPGYSNVDPPRNLISPPAAQTEATITLLWDKPLECADVLSYDIYQDAVLAGNSTRCNFKATNLAPDKTFSFSVKARTRTATSAPSNTATTSTRPKGKAFPITDFGATGDGATDNTAAIQAAIDACVPGGTVVVPAGAFVTGALFVKKSNLTIFLSAGATLKGTHDLSKYPLIKSRYEGRERETCASIITCGSLSTGLTNITIRGPGTIDCQGSFLSGAQTAARDRTKRSHGLLLLKCTNSYLEGFTIQNSPTWCIHPIYCSGLTTEGVTIQTADYGVSNADGWDPDSSTDCYLFNSTLSTHDDCIAIKSGADAEGRRIGRPSANIRVTDCVFRKGGGFAVGSEMSGGVSNVFLQDCHFVSVDRGFNIKTRRKRGGVVENLVVKDVTAERFGQWGVNLEMYYYDSGTPVQPPEATPVFRNFLFENVVIDRAIGPAITMRGLPESRISNVTFKNVTVKDADKGCTVTACDNVLFEDFTACPRNGPLWNNISDNTNVCATSFASHRTEPVTQGGTNFSFSVHSNAVPRPVESGP